MPGRGLGALSVRMACLGDIVGDVRSVLSKVVLLLQADRKDIFSFAMQGVEL